MLKSCGEERIDRESGGAIELKRGQTVVLTLFVSLSLLLTCGPSRTRGTLNPNAAHPIWSNGYEEGDFSAWSQVWETGVNGGEGSLAIEQSVVHSGYYAAYFSVPSGGEVATMINITGGTGTDSCFARVWVYLLTVPSQAGQSAWVMQLYNESNGSSYEPVQALVEYNATLGEAMWALSVSYWGSTNESSIEVTTNVWHEVQLECVNTTLGTDYCRLWVDGALAATGPECEQNMGNVMIGSDLPTFNLNFYADDVAYDSQYISEYTYLMLSVNPNQATYTPGNCVSFDVNVLNQLNSSLISTLTVTVTGPGGYGYFDFERISTTAEWSEYSFNWTVPKNPLGASIPGTYVVEVSLVPMQLTAYDCAWLFVGRALLKPPMTVLDLTGR